MSIISYEHLRGWRDICEYLNSCWYKFSDVDDLYQEFSGSQNQVLWLPEGRELRQQLWGTYLIQFIRWGEHPILYYRDSRRKSRTYKKDRGWTLVFGWEEKIDFLEQVVLLNRDPEILSKPWQIEILRRIGKKIEAKINASQLMSIQGIQLLDQGLCPHCRVPQVVLMMDCPSCKKSYEENEEETES